MLNELCHWSPRHVEEIFENLLAERLPLAPQVDGPVEYIKPPLYLLRQSASEGKALCVNQCGDWSLQSSGYSAISHVWSEGLIATEEGFSRVQLDRLFKTLNQSGLQPQYLWIDTIALPAPGPDLSVEQKELKIQIINTLADVYDHAEVFICMDALLLRTMSTNCNKRPLMHKRPSWLDSPPYRSEH